MSKLNRQYVEEVFHKYTEPYDETDPKIALKINHTYHVAENADRIAKSLHLSEEDQDLAWLLGMLHDIGRFEQIRRYNTFNDAESIAHALMSCEVLFPEEYRVEEHFFQEMPNGRFGRLEDYLNVTSWDENQQDEETALPSDWKHIVRLSISLHSAFRLPEDLTEREKQFCDILRDADKVDIFRVNVETPITDIYNCTEEELENSTTTGPVDDAIREHHVVLRSTNYTLTPADHVAGHCCLAFELVYSESRIIAKEQGYLDQLLSFRNKDDRTNRTMEWLGEELKKFLN